MDTNVLDIQSVTESQAIDLSASYFDALFTLFHRCNSTRSSETITFDDYIEGIRSGRWIEEVNQIREAKKDPTINLQEMKKRTLKAVKISGTFNGLDQDSLIQHSKLLCLDLDNLGDKLKMIRNNLNNDRYVFVNHLSAGGEGLKVIVKINANNAIEHKGCFQAAYKHFNKYIPEGGRLDDKPSNVSSNCFVSYDPDVWVSDRLCSVFEPLPDQEPFILSVPKQKEQRTVEIGDSVDLGEKGEKKEEVISVESKDSTDLQRNKHVRKKAEARLKAMEQGDSLHIKKLYDKYLANRRAIRGERYKFLQNVIPAIYPVFSTEVIIQLLLLHYDLNTGSWNTSRSEHAKEIVQMLKDWSANDYPAQLSAHELMHYNILDDEYQKAAFRICKGLSNVKDANGSFTMSFNNMGFRIGHNRKTGEAVLQELCANQTIQQTQRGVARSKGQLGKATRWKWILNK